MKQLLLILLFLTALASTCVAQFVGDSYKDTKTKGKIDSIVEIRYQFPDNDTTNRSHDDKFVYIFNTKGQLIKSTEHSMDNK
jgi:hypothetical protein